MLVANPDMLMSGLTLVGRQVPVETGFVDLLGIDEDGRLVVFELKREKLTSAAVAQVFVRRRGSNGTSLQYRSETVEEIRRNQYGVRLGVSGNAA